MSSYRLARFITPCFAYLPLSRSNPSRLLIDMLGFKTIEQLIADEAKIMVFKSLHDMAHHTFVSSSPGTQIALLTPCATQQLI